MSNNPLSIPLMVNRNGIDATLTLCMGKRDAWKDKPYQAFQIQTDGTESSPAEDKPFIEGITWWGKQNVKLALNTIFKRFGQDFADDATGDKDTEKAGGLADGIFSVEKFLEYWQKGKSSAMRLSELNEAYQSTVAEFNEFTSGELMAAVQRQTDAMASGDSTLISQASVRFANAKTKMESLSATLKSYKADFEERKARRSKEAATETTSPE